MGTFVINKRQNGQYKYEFTSRKGKAIFISNDFELRFECENAIEFLKTNIENVFFMKLKSKNEKMFFKIISFEKEIAVSRKYTSLFLLQKAINEIEKTILKSEILDFTNQNFVFPSTEDIFL